MSDLQSLTKEQLIALLVAVCEYVDELTGVAPVDDTE